MNLYNLHNKPESLKGFDQRTTVPSVIFDMLYKGGEANRDELLNGIELIKTDPHYATWYAINVIGKRWEEAEEYIEYDAKWWNIYAEEFGLDYIYEERR